MSPQTAGGSVPPPLPVAFSVPEPVLEERRKHPRFAITAFVDWTGDELLLHHPVVNLSLGGLCIESTIAEPVGQRVELVLHFPDRLSVVTVVAEVVWNRPGRPAVMGLRFMDPDARSRAALQRYLDEVVER